MNELNLISESGSPTPPVPIFEDALSFNPTFSDRVDLPLNFVTGTRTISCWVKPKVTTFNGQNRQALWGQYGSSGQRTTYAEFRDTGVIRMYLPTSPSGNSFALIESDAGQYFNGGQWYYISISLDSTTGATMYVDGVAQSSTVSSATLGFTRSGANFQWGNWNILTPHFDGELKDLAIWNTARTQPEILADMTRVFTGSETGLKAYFPTNEGSGGTIQDLTSTYTGNLFTTNTSPTYFDDFMWVEEQVGSIGGGTSGGTKTPLDIYEDEFVSVTKQAFSINNITKRLSGVTNDFSLPLTPNNSNALDFLDVNGNNSNKPYEINYCEFIENGTKVIKKGRLNIKEINRNGYKINVTHGINDFFDRIRDKMFYEPFVSRSPNGVPITSASWQNYTDPAILDSTGIVYPIVDSFQSNPIPEYQQSPFAEVKKAFEFIAQDVDYTFVDNTNGRLTKKAFGGGKLFEYKEEREDISAFFNLRGLGSTVLNTYYTKKKGNIFLAYAMKFEVLAGLGFSLIIETLADGVSINSYSVSPTSLGIFTDYNALPTTTSVYPKGTKIETIITITTNASASIDISFGDYGFPQSSAVGVTENGDCFLENVFGDFTQIDFISYIFEMFNLGFEVNELTKTITAYPLNDVYNPNVGNTIDLSKYFAGVESRKFDNKYGKNNYFTYQYEDGLPNIYDSNLIANNVNKDIDLVKSDITASFHSQTMDLDSFTPFVLKVNGYENNLLNTSSNDIGLRIVNYDQYYNNTVIPNGVQVFGSINFDYLSYAGATINGGFQYITLTDSQGLDWTSLIENNYSSLRDYVLNSYQEVKLLMKTPRYFIEEFSFQSKIFIEQLNSKFVVESIKTRKDGLSEWVLTKLNN